MLRTSPRHLLRLTTLNAAILAALWSTTPAHADTATWIGGSGNSWSTGTNWSGVDPNVAFADVVIDGNSLVNSAVELNTSASVGSLLIDAGDELLVTSVLAFSNAITNQGSLHINYALTFNSDVTLTGTGQTALNGGYIESSNGYAGNTLTIGAGHTLTGRGILGGGYYGYNATRLVNQGTIVANSANPLYVYATSLDNSNGLIQITDGSTLYATGAVNGGTIQSLGNATLSGSGSFSSLTVKGGMNLAGNSFSDVVFEDTNTLSGGAVAIGGTITNKGTLQINSTALTFNTDVTLTGTGQTVLNGGYIESSNGYVGNTLTIGAGHTLMGRGILGGGAYGYNATRVINQGTIVADGASPLYVYASSLDNSSGLIQITDGSTLYATGTISGGTIQSLGNATLSGGTFKDLTLTGQFQATSALNIAGTITDQGTLLVNSNALLFNADVTLAGAGQTVLNGGYIESSNGYTGNTLTIGTGHTLSGRGYLGGGYYGYNATRVINQGTIVADGASPLYVYASSLDNSSGLIQITDGSTLYATGAISGGTIQSLGSATLSGNGSFSNLTVKGGMTIAGNSFSDVVFEDTNTLSGGAVTIGGTINNKGSLVVNSYALLLNTDATLTGAGQTVLNGGYIESSNGYTGNTLTIGAGHTLRGSGYLGGGYYGYNATRLVNRGTIVVDGANPLYVYATSLDNSGGLIQIANGSTLHGANGIISGGTIQGLGTDTATLSGGTFQDLTLTGQLQATSTLTVAGTITNQGTLQIKNTALLFNTDVMLAGNGQTVLNGGYIESTNGYVSNTLTIGAGHTLRGSGYLGGGYYGYNATRIVNRGTLLADAANPLHYYGPLLTNRGRIQVNNGSSLQVQGGSQLVQDDAGAKTVVDGNLAAPVVELQAGSLSGSGTVTGDVLNTGGQVNPGSSPGTLVISGNYTQGQDGDLVIELDGTVQGVSYDWLSVGGNASLDGDLYLDVGFFPADGSTFTFLTTLSGTVSGTFDHVYATGWNVVTTYASNSVSVTLTAAAVPEPESYALVLAGLAVVGAGALSRHRRQG